MSELALAYESPLVHVYNSMNALIERNEAVRESIRLWVILEKDEEE